jgi:tetratricopeptide (TPR) repeat protein
MRELIQRLTKELSAFVEQRDDLILLVSSTSQDSAIALKVLRDLDRASPADLFLLFADDFTDAASFVDLAVKHLKEEHRLASEGRAQAGEEPPRPLPDSLLRPGTPPAKRLHEALDVVHSWPPPQGGNRLVWAMFPAQVANWPEYLKLVASCLPRQAILPWMRGLRLIFRADEGFVLDSSPLAGARRVRQTRIDFGPDALSEDLRKTAENEKRPMADRMEALLSLAFLASAHGRFAEAETHFGTLLDYYRKIDHPLMEAMVANGLGEMAHRQGDLDKARAWFETAVPPIVAAKEALVMSNVVQNLAAVSYEQGRYADAEEYYDGLATLRECLVDEDGKAQALEWRGLSQEKQNAYEKAVLSWEEAELLCRVFELDHRRKPLLEHLRRAYKKLGMSERLAALEEEEGGRPAKTA